MSSNNIDAEWTQKIRHDMMERLLCNLAIDHPEEYARAHAAHPDLFPDVAGNIPAPEVMTVHLNEGGVKALKHYSEVVASLHTDGNKQAAERIIPQVGDLRVDQALRKGFIERMVDNMEGGNKTVAKNLEKTIRTLLKSLSKGEYLNSDKIKTLLGRMPKISA